MRAISAARWRQHSRAGPFVHSLPPCAPLRRRIASATRLRGVAAACGKKTISYARSEIRLGRTSSVALTAGYGLKHVGNREPDARGRDRLIARQWLRLGPAA